MFSIRIRKARDSFALDVAIEAPTRGVLALFGRSGCGKTTLVNVIAGLLDADEARIVIDDVVLEALLDALTADTEGRGQAVRVFPISYGEGADLATLRRIAEASQAAVYDSSDPRSISKVFVAVVSNF